MIESVECANAFIFILAGGKSARMGTDKAFLTLHGKTLLERALGVAASVAEEVYIVGDRQKFLQFGQVVEDVFAGCGPLGGIHAALRQTAADLNLMLAVDLPFVDAKLLKYLIFRASQCDAVVTVPLAGGNWQPLCAVYRREFAGAAEIALQKGMNKIDPLFAQVKTRAIREKELSRSGFGASMFRNLNTPEEFEGAEKEIVRGDD
jgi:molybdopterin-guanine dinucleotide biosynthesis protein A